MKNGGLVCLAFASFVIFQNKPAGAAERAEIETAAVTLYDSGLAQLVDKAVVKGAKRLKMKVPLAHLDDMIASLYFTSTGTVKIRGLNYPTVENLGQAVHASSIGQALSSAEEGEVMLPEQLSAYAKALVGTNVAVALKNGKTVEGVVMSCVDDDSVVQVKAGAPEEEKKIIRTKTLVLTTEKGVLSLVPLSDVQRISPVSSHEASAIRDFVTQLGKTNGFLETAVEVETTKASNGTLSANYVRQMPVWRMSYKITADDKGIFLEAWAVVHNDTGDDWNDVEMTLVSGLPKSYVFSLASPRYGEREGLELDEGLRMMPQLGAKTSDSLLYDFMNIGTHYYGLSGTGIGGGGGSGYGSIGTIGHGGIAAASEESSDRIRLEESAMEETMVAEVEAEISTYRALSKVTIPNGSSSVVPVIRRRLDGESFTMIGSGGNAETCVKALNSTGVVLQGGLSSFYINGRFRGQAELYRTEPNDTRLICFGEDPDVRSEQKVEVTHRYQSLEWKNDGLLGHSIKRTTADYSIENMSGQSRKLAIEIRHIKNGRVVSPVGASIADEDGRKVLLFELGPKQETSKQVIVEEGVVKPLGYTKEILEALLSKAPLPKDEQSILRRALKAIGDKETAEKNQKQAERTRDKLINAIERKRDIMSSMPRVRRRNKILRGMVLEVLELEKEVEQLDDRIEELKAAAMGADKAFPIILKDLERS